MSRNIAVISGASGFVGQRLIKALTEKNIETVAISRELFYYPIHLQKFLEKISPLYIYHLAAYGNMPFQKEPDKIIQANILGTMGLLAASKNVRYKAFVNVSSSSVLLPHETFYSATKAGAERICKAFQLEFNKPIISVRPYSLYGIGEAHFRFIPTVFRSCLTGEEMNLAPNSFHDWTYVDDFADNLIMVADNPFAFSGKIHGFGTGKSMSNAKIVTMIEKLTGKEANITDYKSMRAYDVLGWKADPLDDFITKTQLKDGLRLYYESIK